MLKNSLPHSIHGYMAEKLTGPHGHTKRADGGSPAYLRTQSTAINHRSNNGEFTLFAHSFLGKVDHPADKLGTMRKRLSAFIHIRAFPPLTVRLCGMIPKSPDATHLCKCPLLNMVSSAHSWEPSMLVQPERCPASVRVPRL